MRFLIVDPWQSSVCFIKSGVTRCTLLMVLYLARMCQRGLHAVLWSHIGTLMHCRTLKYSRTFIPFSVSLWNELANPVFDGVGRAGFKSRANACVLALAALSLLLSSTLFPCLFFLSIGWYYRAGVFGLIGCLSLSLSLALPTFFNNNSNNDNNNEFLLLKQGFPH